MPSASGKLCFRNWSKFATMKISTKTGDKGLCSLMFGVRVPKHSKRVCAYGTIDEFCSTLGLAKAETSNADLKNRITEVQNALIKLMTELATPNEKYSLLLEKKIPILGNSDLKNIENQISEIENDGSIFKCWTLAGENKLDAYLNLSRTICRRAEREMSALFEVESAPRELPLMYINRLSDLLYLWSLKASKNEF